jgi:hypothetical protein
VATKAITQTPLIAPPETLDALAAVEGRDRAALVRRSIDEMLARSRADAGFQRHRRESLERRRALLERLSAQ